MASRASAPSDLARRVLASGWPPATLVFLVAVHLLHHTGLVPFQEILAFAAWFVWCQTVPGTILWRVVDWRSTRRPFLEDVVLGSVLGIVLAVPVYLVLVSLGIQRLTLLWPLLVVLPLALTARGRVLLRHRPSLPMPRWWSWSLALVVLYMVVWSSHNMWAENAITLRSMRAPFIDEPFHLSLISEFRHHFPAEFPYVQGVPLRYHWLVYPFFASGTWGASISPLVVLRLLGPATLTVLLVLGVAVAARRLSGHNWTALAGPALILVVTPLDVFSWTSLLRPWRGPAWALYGSPTQALANALCPLLVVLLVGMLRGAAVRPRHWVATAAVMLAVAGAKSSMLPLFVAGLCGAAVVMLVVHRRIPWRVAGLAVTSLVVSGLATVLFYGRGSRALTLSPFQVIDDQAAADLLTAPGHAASGVVRLSLLVVFLVVTTAPLIGGVGLFVRGGWRRPVPWVLLGCWVAALGATLLLRHPSLGQIQFLWSALVPTTVFAALGWARVAGPMTRTTRTVMGASLAVGIAVAYLIPAATAVSTTRVEHAFRAAQPLAVTAHAGLEQTGSSDAARMFVSFGIPLLLALATVVVVLVGFTALTRRMPLLRGRGLLVVSSMVVGMCLTGSVAQVAALRHSPGPRTQAGVVTIQAGGLAAAAWLREHSSADDLVATNVHSWRDGPGIGTRQFWISGYTERRILVEGWAYIPPEAVGLPSTEANNASNGIPTFWDQDRLRLNDEVFARPTKANLHELQQKYGVKWLFAQKGRRVNLLELAALTDLRKSTKNYDVYELRS